MITAYLATHSILIILMLVLAKKMQKTNASLKDINEIKKRLIAVEREKMHRWDGKGVRF